MRNLVILLILTGQCFSTSFDDYNFYEINNEYVEGLEEELLRIPDIVGFHAAIENRINISTYNFTCVAKCDYEFHIQLYVDNRSVHGYQIQSAHDPTIFHVTVTGPVLRDTKTAFRCIVESAFGSTTNNLDAMPHAAHFMNDDRIHLPFFIAKFDKHNCDVHMSYYLLPDNFPIRVILANENSTEIVYDSRAETRYLNDTNCDTNSILMHYEVEGFHYNPSGIYFKFDKTVDHKEEVEYYPEEVNPNEPDPKDVDIVPWKPAEIASVGFTLADCGKNFVELKLECSAKHEEHLIAWYAPGRKVGEQNRSRHEITLKLSKDDMMTHEYVCQVCINDLETSEIYLTISSVMNFDTIKKYSALFLFPNGSKEEAIFNVHLKKNHMITPENVFIEGKHKTFYAKTDAHGVFYASGKLANLMSKYKFYTNLHKKYQLNFEISRKSLFDEYYKA